MQFKHTHSSTIAALAIVVAIVFSATSAAQPVQVAVDPWVAVSAAAGGSLVNAEAWIQRRTELGLGNAALPLVSMQPTVRTDAILRMHEAGFLGAERTLLSAGRDASLISPQAAERWDAVLRDVESELLGGDELGRRVLAFDLAERGSLAALLPEHCLALEGSERDALDALVALDVRTPFWRLRSNMELEAASAPVAESFAPALHAAIALLGASPASPRYSSSSDVCGGDVAALFAALAHVDATSWQRLEAALRTIAAVTAIPDRAWVRPATSAYARADLNALNTIAELGAAGQSGPWLVALVAAAGDDEDARDVARAALPDGAEAWQYWVRGELARRSGRHDDALPDLGAAVDADPYFALALLSRASALAAAGRAHDALADLHHLRLTYPGATPYAALIDALDRRLR